MAEGKLTRFEEVFNDILDEMVGGGKHGSSAGVGNGPIGFGMALIALGLHDLADALQETMEFDRSEGNKERSREDG